MYITYIRIILKFYQQALNTQIGIFIPKNILCPTSTLFRGTFHFTSQFYMNLIYLPGFFPYIMYCP